MERSIGKGPGRRPQSSRIRARMLTFPRPGPSKPVHDAVTTSQAMSASNDRRQVLKLEADFARIVLLESIPRSVYLFYVLRVTRQFTARFMVSEPQLR